MPSKDAQHNEGGFGESRNDNTNANKHLVVQGDQIGQFDSSTLIINKSQELVKQEN